MFVVLKPIHRAKILAQRFVSYALVVIASLAVLVSTTHNVRSTMHVDLVLVLALDVSDSVNSHEYELQRIGLASAFRHPELISAIQACPAGRIAVTAMQWSGFQDQYVSVPWRIVADKDSANAFANRISNMPRRYPNGYTHIAGAIEYSTKLLLAAPFMARRLVVDISGDGENNVNTPPHAARDAAVRAGVTVNGLAIVNESKGLVRYYEQNVIGGPGAFVVRANNYEDYVDAILAKLLREINCKYLS